MIDIIMGLLLIAVILFIIYHIINQIILCKQTEKELTMLLQKEVDYWRKRAEDSEETICGLIEEISRLKKQ